MATEFEKYAAKGNEFMSLLKEDLQVQDEKALRILKCVLHTIRDHVSLQESLQIISQLPMIIKAVYVDQWNVNQHAPRIHHLYDFFEQVRARDKELAEYDFTNYDATSNAVKAVFRTMHYYISEGEMEDMIAVMPGEIKNYIIDIIGTGRMAL